MKQPRLVEFSLNHPKLIMALAAAVTIVALFAIPNAQIDTDPENMLSANEPVRLIHSEIKDEFNLSDFLVVGFVREDSELLTPDFAGRLRMLTERIEELEGVVVEDIMAPSTVDDIYRNSEGALVVSKLDQPRKGIDGPGPTLAEKISQNPVLAGKLGSADGRAVALYIPLEEKKYAHVVALAIEEAIEEIGGFPTAHIAGLPIAEEVFGGEMFRQMAISAPMAGALIFILLIVFFRNLTVTLSAMMVAMMTVIITMGTMIALGFTVHIMSSMIAIFLMPIAVLDSVHILSEFHDRYQKSHSQREAIATTMSELYKPMLFTSITTFVGFISLMMADIPPVRVFGAFVALGVAVAWLLSMTFSPAYAVLIPKKALSNFGRVDEGEGLLARALPKLGRWAMKYRGYVVTLTALALIVSAVGITKIQINDNPIRWFKYDHPIRLAERTLKSHLAGTYLAYLRFDATDTESGLARTPEALRYMQGLQNILRSTANVGSTTGITDIVKKVRFELHDGDSAMYSLPDSENEIAQELFLYEISGGDPEDLFKFITPEGDKALLWIQMKEGDNQAVAEIVATVDEFIATNPAPAGMAFNWAGLSYINIVWQEKMVSGMLKALLGSILVVSLMMIFLLRSVFLGLISMVPLSLTIAVVYGAVGFAGKDYDMPIAVLSSLTLGLSIDFAIHFLKRGQEISRQEHMKGHGQGADHILRILFGEPSRAIARNIFVIALGFTPLLFSALVPYITVGAFFLAIMGLSGLATLVILPALVRLRGPNAFVRWGEK